ncbi:MAG TPA: phospholipid carrier-dependent glycosyltransferase [Candidatus Acidoferrales bacterium]|nr:phospholipid carrier-dependent glycosyltransferase [Candidatus Acidoferrales bacterium]
MRSAVRPRPSSVTKDDTPRSARATALAFAGMLLAAFIIRLIFIGAEGFSNDVGSFESWALTLSQHSTRDFYATAGFADYPPGYFFILWIVGHAYALLVHSDPTYGILKVFVKLPSIITDLICSALLFAIVRRFAALPWAFAAAALFAFNPATIYISAYWGQVDSVAAAVVLAMIYCIVANDEAEGRPAVIAVAAAWVLLTYSILIKPPATVLIPLLFAYPFVAKEPAKRMARLTGTALGVVLGLFVAYLAAFAFHPGISPIAQFEWLYERYRYASSVYPYNSINAFNIYTIRWPFWNPDSIAVFTIGGFTLQQYALGIALVLVSTVFIVVRYLQKRTLIAFLEGALLLSLGFFILATRMHERYIFNAVVLCISLIFAGRRYLYSSILLSLSLLVNLIYSLWYLHIVGGSYPGVDARNIDPWVTRPLSVMNVAIFFYLAYQYMDPEADGVLSRVESWFKFPTARTWFAPLEGTARMLRLDWLLAGGFTLASFVLTFQQFWIPEEKVFDEIYYARAAEEYLQHKEIFEFTHPPLTKLIITASTLLFGGLSHGLGHGGDTSFGWRFLNVVVGALMVGVLYLFAKRILGSTAFASICAGLLLFDGFHFAQSRIATPEISVAFFTLTTLYAFYRFWIASSVRIAPKITSALNIRLALVLAVGTAVALVLAWFVVPHISGDSGALAIFVSFVYFQLGIYLAVRLLLPRFMKAPTLISYADGTRLTEQMLRTPDGGSIDLRRRAITAGELSANQQGTLVLTNDPLRIEYTNTGEERYLTPAGQAHFTPDATMEAGAARVHGTEGLRWMFVLAVSAGLLGACKWNGLFDFFVVWVLVAAVVLQPYLTPLLRGIGLQARQTPALWGNPYGFSFDLVAAAMLFIGGTIYVLCYIPYFSLGHTLTDLIGLQKQMFFYHYDLHATHPYSSKWWQWPLLQIPISYYYADSRHGLAASNPAACCLKEILALPNPVVWWTGLISVPLLAWWAWFERNKGYALLVTAYMLQWLPWILSPRISFEYHFFPNLAIICLADTVLLQRIWHRASTNVVVGKLTLPQVAVCAYLAAVIGAFIFWYPVVAGTPETWNAWDARMLTPLEGNNWINPHPGQ